METNIYGMKEYYAVKENNTYGIWAGGDTGKVSAKTAGRDAVKLTIAPTDNQNVVLNTPIYAGFAGAGTVTGNTTVSVSGGIYPKGFKVDGKTVGEALASGCAAYNYTTGQKLSYAASDAAISGYAELLKSGMVAPGDVGGFSERIYLESQRMIRLVEDILKLSRLDEGGSNYTLEPVDLCSIAATALPELESVAQKQDVTLTCHGEPAMVSGVPHLLTAIVTNLVSNAIKYNRPQGTVEISVKNSDRGAVLTVTDTGIGIPESHQEQIFQRFYRVDKSHSKAVGGTGLGLSIVKHAAQIHNATVELDSRENEGTTIKISFPKL